MANVRRIMRQVVFFAALALSVMAPARAATRLSPEVRQFVRVDAPVIALTGVHVIDGTGAGPREDQTLVIASGKIRALGDSATIKVPAGTKILALPGYTIIPGLVGMHDHMFYGAPKRPFFTEMPFSFPRLYLAGGVTTIRTTGSLEPYTDLQLRQAIEAGEIPGPRMDVTGPYFDGAASPRLQVHHLTGPDDARRMAEFWADAGVTSFKAYAYITRSELAAVIEVAHRRGLKVAGHLCAVGFRDAAALGIDDLEHGISVDGEFVPGKKPDVCPSSRAVRRVLARLRIDSPPVKRMISELVAHHVAVTSTLAVDESLVPSRAPLPRVLAVQAPQFRADYLAARVRLVQRVGPDALVAFKKEMEFQRAFAAGGGLLMAGEDPTGIGGVVAGIGDQREVELLVEAGFSPVQAIHIATENGARYLGMDDRIGSLAVGKAADVVVIRGNPVRRIADVENVEIVFKDGVGYDSAKLIDSVRGEVGFH